MFAKLRFSGVTALIWLILCALPPNNATAINYSNVCRLVSNNELIASQDSCSDYYICQNGIAVEASCPSGLYFSRQAQQCMPAASVNCASADLFSPCDSSNVGTWTSVPGSCQNYYYCSPTGPLLGTCPNGQNFAPSSQSCVFPTQYPCSNNNGGDSIDSGEVDVVNFCLLVADGVFFGNAGSCRAWNLCSNGVMTNGFCPEGFNFNPILHKCDYIGNVNCNQVTNDPNLVFSPNTNGPCSVLGSKTPAVRCNGYYVCNGVEYVLNTCQYGYYFDTKLEICVPRINAQNDCDRCQGTTLPFVNAYSTSGCDDYLVCSNGFQVGSGTCANSYFDETKGGCVTGDSSQPSFGCCNPTPSSTSTSSTTPSSTVAGPPGPPATTTKDEATTEKPETTIEEAATTIETPVTKAI